MRALILCLLLVGPVSIWAQDGSYSSDEEHIVTLLHSIDKQTAVTATKVIGIEKRVEEMKRDMLAQYVALEKRQLASETRLLELEKFQWRFAGAVTVLVAFFSWVGPLLTNRKIMKSVVNSD